MKKVYLTALAALVGGMSFAQHVNGPSAPKFPDSKLDPMGSKVKTNPAVAAKGATIWSDDCSSLAGWTLTQAGNQPVDWAIETDPAAIPVAALSPMGSATASNGYMFISSDANNTADFDGTTINSEFTNSTPIDLTGSPSVSLLFSHNYRWWQDTRGVRVSGDNGTTWTDFELTNQAGSPATGQNSGNPTMERIDISAVAGDSSQVLVQFYYNDNEYWGWYWAVDDISIVENDPSDLEVNNVNFGSLGSYGIQLPYYQMPTTQISDVNYYAVVSNIGAEAQPNSIVSVDVNSGTFTGTSATGFTSATGASMDTLNLTTLYTPAATVGATHTATYTVSSDSVDYDPSNNTGTSAFDVTEFIYARDNGSAESTAGNGGQGYELGNVFDIYNDQTIYGIDVTIATNSEAGAGVYAKLYLLDATGRVYMDESDLYTITAADVSAGATITLPFFTPQQLTAGQSYLIVAASFGDGGATNDLRIATGGDSEAQTSNLYDETDQTWYYVTSTPQVRMNFDISIGVDEIENEMTLGQSFPNPTNDVATINYSLTQTEDIAIEVTDVTGKVVEIIREGVRTAGDYQVTVNVANYESGVYFYSLTNGVSKTTKSFTVAK